MIIPPFLKKGDKAGILSTARKITKKQIRPAVNMLESWGLKVITGRTTGLSHHQYAGNDGQRAGDLQTMLDDPEIRLIWCAKGGYGTVRIIDRINFQTFLKNPKWIAGYSDVTVLHAHLNNHFNVATIHSPMAGEIAQKGSPTDAIRSFRNAIFGKPERYVFPPSKENQGGTTEGVLVGGNLSILYNLQCSSSDFSPAGKILFLEEVDEYLYHIDRMLWSLKRSGKLDRLSGMVVGGMTEMNDNEVPFGKQAREILKEHLEPLSIPVCYDFPSGHLKDNRSFYLGVKSRLTCTPKKSRVEFIFS